MKTVIFAGGQGTRIAEESHLRPKPMIEIGGKPILWHIMKIFEKKGFNEFIICLGYKGYMIKEYFLNYFLHNSDVTVDLQNNNVEIHKTDTNSFKVTLVDTGMETRTAGRLKRVKNYVSGEDFFLTYGDGLADIDLLALLNFHKEKNRIVTMTAVQPEGKFGAMQTNDNGIVLSFKEKPKGDGNWINGGFFVVKNQIFEYLTEKADEIMWEEEPLEILAQNNQLAAYKHYGFWRCMDALRDKVVLEDLWAANNAKWKIW